MEDPEVETPERVARRAQAKAEMDELFPPMTECIGDEQGYACGESLIKGGSLNGQRIFIGCPVHFHEAEAGRFLVHADLQFKKRVLEMLTGKINLLRAMSGQGEASFLAASLTDVIGWIRNMDDGYMRDCVRRAKGK